MNLPRHIAELALTCCLVVSTPAFAGESTFKDEKSGAAIAYDDSQWEATTLVGNPYFSCLASDCSATTCMVIASVDPDFIAWPETVDATSLSAINDIFLDYEKSNTSNEVEIAQPTHLKSIGDRDTLVTVIRTKRPASPQLSPRYAFKDGGMTRLVTCEGDEESITKMNDRIEALVGAIKFPAP